VYMTRGVLLGNLFAKSFSPRPCCPRTSVIIVLGESSDGLATRSSYQIHETGIESGMEATCSPIRLNLIPFHSPKVVSAVDTWLGYCTHAGSTHENHFGLLSLRSDSESCFKSKIELVPSHDMHLVTCPKACLETVYGFAARRCSVGPSSTMRSSVCLILLPGTEMPSVDRISLHVDLGTARHEVERRCGFTLVK
jgi:hypothetical protein